MPLYSDIARQCTTCGKLFAPQDNGTSLCEWHPTDKGIPPEHPDHMSQKKKEPSSNKKAE